MRGRAGLVAGLLLAACSGSHGRAVPRPVPSATAAGLPVTACPTEHAAGSVSPRFAATLPAPAGAQGLAWFSDDQRFLMPVLAPAGWSCSVIEATDGGVSLTVWPPGTSATSLRAVHAEAEPACQGCVAGLVCSVVPMALEQLGYTYEHCPQPSHELVHFARGSAAGGSPVDDVIEVEDPAGSHGTAAPSGGPDPSNAVVLYRWSAGQSGSAAEETCALPESEHARCTVILNDFIARDWGMPGPSAG